MKLQERKKVLVGLGERIKNLEESTIKSLSIQAVNENNWFTEPNIRLALNAWATVLTTEQIDEWTSQLSTDIKEPKTIGLVMAGNLPLVGLHDLLTVIVSGHIAAVKLSSQDSALMKFVIETLRKISPSLANDIKLVEQLKDADAVIATGSDNTARYFKQYFGHKPHIIRQNRTSIAIMKGSESNETLENLGKDIFSYYGLGCRNISKVFVPQNADLRSFIDGLMSFEKVIEHHKYRNNYDYNKSIYLVNNEPHLDSGFFLMRETEDLVSPISVIFYERYESEAQLALRIASFKEKVQCIVSEKAWYPNSFGFGQAQEPALWDYADGINTLDFLEQLN